MSTIDSPISVLCQAPSFGFPDLLDRGLRISDRPTSDNLTPQETTKQGIADMGPDGAGLSWPGSSVVADADDESEK